MVKFKPRAPKSKVSGRKLSEKQKSQVKSLMTRTRIMKSHDIQANIAVSTTGTVTSLTGIPSSTQPTIEQREDPKIQLKRLMYRFQVVGADATNQIRAIIFQWKPDDANDAPTVAKVLHPTGGSVAMDPYIYHRAERKKYKIISDRLYGTENVVGPNQYAGKLDFKYSATGRLIRDIYYNGTATTGKNKLFLLLVSDSGAAAHPTYMLNGNVEFYDT